MRINPVYSLLVAASLAVPAGSMAAGMLTIDLTHAIPTFAPSEEDPMKADLSKPYLDSVPIPTFGGQAVFSLGKFDVELIGFLV